MLHGGNADSNLPPCSTTIRGAWIGIDESRAAAGASFILRDGEIVSRGAHNPEFAVQTGVSLPMVRILQMVFSGSKAWCHAEADDEHELRRMAERLRVPVKEDSRGQHLDLDVHKRKLALRYGAVERKD